MTHSEPPHRNPIEVKDAPRSTHDDTVQVVGCGCVSAILILAGSGVVAGVVAAAANSRDADLWSLGTHFAAAIGLAVVPVMFGISIAIKRLQSIENHLADLGKKVGSMRPPLDPPQPPPVIARR